MKVLYIRSLEGLCLVDGDHIVARLSCLYSLDSFIIKCVVNVLFSILCFLCHRDILEHIDATRLI